MARLFLPLYVREIRIQEPDRLKWDGPLLLACNHPNSFLDSVLLDTLFEKPVWSLARGDTFRNKWVARILHSLRILPVYRTSEGSENLHINYRTFESCLHLFREKGIVTIYSEAKCINEWRLRPLRKGTARLAIQTWSAGIPLRVLPVSINYSSYHRYGKNLIIQFGDVIESTDIPWEEPEGNGIRHSMKNYSDPYKPASYNWIERIRQGEKKSSKKNISLGNMFGVLSLQPSVGYCISPCISPYESWWR